jgi:hypothetical protein
MSIARQLDLHRSVTPQYDASSIKRGRRTMRRATPRTPDFIMVQFDPTSRNINDRPHDVYIMQLDACLVAKHPITGRPVEMAFGRWLDDPPETEDVHRADAIATQVESTTRTGSSQLNPH